MDTVEALQSNSGSAKENVYSGHKKKSSTNSPQSLEYLASAPLSFPDSERNCNSWERQALVKRIVELTAELSSKVSRDSIMYESIHICLTVCVMLLECCKCIIRANK